MMGKITIAGLIAVIIGGLIWLVYSAITEVLKWQ